MSPRTAVLAGILMVLLVALPTGAAASTTDGVAVSGTVFLDLDNDGTRDEGEPGRGNVQVTLRTSATILDAVVTTADGTWTFNNVQPGGYGLVVEPPSDHRVTGGTVPELDRDTGEGVLEVADSAVEDAGEVGIGSPVSSGPDVAATVTLDEEASPAGTFRWQVDAHNLGPQDADGPVDLRLVLSSGHETTDVEAGQWACEPSTAIVLCQLDTEVPAGSSLPPLTVTTAAVGEVGAAVSVTATVRLEGVFDAAPLNDEDEAGATISGDVATTDLDGDGAGDLTDAGAATTGMLVAGLLALVVGAAALSAARHATRRP